jgi:multiple sugar transport system substrate-binding protein
MDRRALLSRSAALVGCATLSPLTLGQADRFSRFRGVTLNLSIPSHPHYDAMTKLISEFTAVSGIRVELDRQPIPKMKELQLADLAKPQSSYDLVSYVVMWKSEYVKKNLIQQLEPFFANTKLADPAFDIKDIASNYLENLGLVGGWRGYLAGPTAKLYGLPYGAETSILAYRTDVFDKLKLKVPATYWEFEQLLPLLQDKAGMGALTSRAKEGHQCVHAWLLHFNPMGGQVFDVSWKPSFNGKAGVRALELLQKIIATGPQGMLDFGQAEMMKSFLQGESAMYLDSTIIFGSVRDAEKSKVVGKVGYARHPKAGRHSSQSGGLGLAIPKTTKNPEAAFLLMQWLTSKEQDKAVSRLGGSPSRTSTLLDEGLARQFPEYLVMRNQLRDANPDWRPIIAEWDEINTKALGVSIHAALSGKASAQKALDDAVPLVVSVMRRGGYLPPA